jgi:undecaprenyl diphosphate synthase
MSLFMDSLNKEVAELDEHDIQLSFIGETSLLNSALQETMRAAEIRTQNNQGMKLTLAVAYGGRADLVNAAKLLAQKVSAGDLKVDQIDERHFSEALKVANLPDVDLLVRTGGEYRISNFLLWNLAYSELYFSDVLWPDFQIDELIKAFEFYATRQRRFGHTEEQIKVLNC